MLGTRDGPLDVFSAAHIDMQFIGEKTVYGFFARRWRDVFTDYDFADLYRPQGRPSTPPSKLAIAFFLQLMHGLSDDALIDATRYDLRFKVALQLDHHEALCAKSTLQAFRTRLIVRDKDEWMLRRTVELAKAAGMMKRKGKGLTIALDTTPVLGAGAVRDTINLLGDAIRALLRVMAKAADRPLKRLAREHDLLRFVDSDTSLKGGAGIDWNDRAAVRAFVRELVADADRALEAARDAIGTVDERHRESIRKAATLLADLLAQDIDRGPAARDNSYGGDGEGGGEGGGDSAIDNNKGRDDSRAGQQRDGDSATQRKSSRKEKARRHQQKKSRQNSNKKSSRRKPTTKRGASGVAATTRHNEKRDADDDGPRIRRGTAKDRIVSTTDPEMRHGRKSSSVRFEGHKAAIGVDADSGVILDAQVRAGNDNDCSGALEAVGRIEAAHDVTVTRTLGDCAYGDGATREAFAEAGRELVAKVPKPATRAGQLPKSQFDIDTLAGTVTCPGGHTTSHSTRLTITQHGQPATARVFHFDAAACASCPLKSQCTSSAHRSITVGPQEDLLADARVAQGTAHVHKQLGKRQKVEHRIARLKQLGMGRSRYRGRRKTALQLRFTAAFANLVLVLGTAGAAGFGLAALLRVATSPCWTLLSPSGAIFLLLAIVLVTARPTHFSQPDFRPIL